MFHDFDEARPGRCARWRSTQAGERSRIETPTVRGCRKLSLSTYRRQPSTSAWGREQTGQAHSWDLGDHGIAAPESRKPPKVSVGCPQLGYSVLEAQGGNSCIVDLWTRYAAGTKNVPEVIPVVFRFGKQDQTWRFEPGLHLIQCRFDWCRRSINPGVGRNGQKLVDARPRCGPGRSSLGQFKNACVGGLVPRRVFAVGVNQEIAVDGNQPPRPS
jgi:hypothetical protein